MATVHRFRSLCGLLLAVAVAMVATRLSAADSSSGSAGSSTAAASSAPVDMFDAMRGGDLGVQFIPHSSREATLILTNNTDQPLNVHLPEAFAAIPVVAQFGQAAGGGGRQTGTGNNNKQNQGLGGGAGQGQRQGAGGFGGAVANGQAGAGGQGGANAGAFSIPPERVVKLKLPTVCLDYGKAEPNAHVPYTIVPIETYTINTEVREVCRMLGQGQVSQSVAQAAAWHLSNHLSWDKLTDMKHFPHNAGFTHPVFSSDQIRAAMELTDKAIKLADARSAAEKTSPGQKTAPSAATTSLPAVPN